MTKAWVLGSSGLLGSALCRSLRRNGTDLFVPADRFCWDNVAELSTQIAAAVEAFSSQIGATDRWEIYWAAGVGAMSSSAESLAPETRALSLLLQRLEDDSRLMGTSGTIAFASSAGAIYAESSDDIITENTEPTPTTDYAREKLRQEDLVRTFAIRNSRTNALISRISSLYGSGQATGKKQGLLTHIARSILRNRPIQIYVPYDTMRDYITADDAAATMIAALGNTNGNPRVLTKIVASEQPTTIAEIISVFRRIARRSPRIITSASKLSSLYARRVQFQSIVLPELPITPPQSLIIGIARLMTAERSAFVSRAGETNPSRN